MPGAHSSNRPVPAGQLLAASSASQLVLHLQSQLQDDVASDVYTECNIQHEEEEIISYLERKLNVVKSNSAKSHNTKEGGEEPEVFSTPNCVTPYVENDFQKVINSSPSTELTKEYYALVPIEGNLLEKELTEQDELLNAFNSIIKGQTEDTRLVNKIVHCNKPTTLPLNSSHTPKTVKHSSSCDILNKICLKDNISLKLENNLNIVFDKDFKTNQKIRSGETIDPNTSKNTNKSNSVFDKPLDPSYSPDSLITDEPSSSSDYLSAAYTFSPGAGCQHQVNVESTTFKMENIYTLSDSGLDDTAMLGSVSSHKDVTLTNMSLSENTLHDLLSDDASISATSVPSYLVEKNHCQRSNQSGTSSEKDYNGHNTVSELCGKSLKEEKQRINEEIVILESSSLSSETGSWESVYPPKLVEKEICEKFLLNERCQYLGHQPTNTSLDENQLSFNSINKSPLKSTACFIDASGLVDAEIQSKDQGPPRDLLNILPAPSQPVPCSTAKLDISPIDCSDGGDNEDSLEQPEKKDSDSIQKDLSPTIFEMTPITEDSLCTNTFENATQPEVEDGTTYISDKDRSLRVSAVFISNTPNNSIMSLKTYKQYESEDSESNNTIIGAKQRENSRSPPILSGGVSVEDHLPQIGNNHESMSKFNLENTPIVTGTYVPQTVDHSHSKPRTSSASAWVVDMSIDPKTDDSISINSKSSEDTGNEKKNIFSMYIDLGDKSTLKDMPARLSSSINTKKNFAGVENKSTPRNSKTTSNTHSDSVSIFEKYESLCNDPNISISEIIAIPEKHESIPVILEHPDTNITPKSNQSRTHKSGDKMAPQKERAQPRDCQETKELSSNNQAKDLFVKLSDLDRTAQQIHFDTTEVDVRMTRSIPDWGEQGFATNSRSIEAITSFHSENALSLNRLFPHLKNEFSRSMPGSLSSRTRSPLRLVTSVDEQISDNMSEISSMQSSHCRSGYGNSTTEATSSTISQMSSLIENCTSRLGQDLLRMFLEEIAPDVIVEVSGKRFKAHKCILSSRCQYFAGMLSGGWVESSGNVIVLPPFSYNVVHFALCHIYSGLATIPDSVSIVELATIADMLGLEGLKEAIMFTLKAKYCHHFHKPCPVCIAGVLECFPLSSVYGLDDLYQKCLKWITKYFTQVWPTKAFAHLPTDLLDKCYQHHTVTLTVDNVVDTVYGCGIIVSSLPNDQWSETVARICRRLISAASHFIGPRLLLVLQAIAPLTNDAHPVAKKALEDCLEAAIEWAPPEEVCRAYGYISAIFKEIKNNQHAKPHMIANGTNTRKNLLYAQAGTWRLKCEGALVRASPRVVTLQAFKELPSELRIRLRELGCIKYGEHALPLTQTTQNLDRKKICHKIIVKNKPLTSTTSNVDIAHVRASFVPYSQRPVIPLYADGILMSNNNVPDRKKQLVYANPPKVRTTKAQEERAKFNKLKSATSDDRLHTKTNANRVSPKTKPKYLELTVKKTTALNKRLYKIDSSSESSANASPVLLENSKLNLKKGQRGAKDKAQTMSQDSLATSSRPRTAEPSTDSLTESQTSNKFATYTKTKCSIKTVKDTKTEEISVPAVARAKEVTPNKNKTKIPIYASQKLKKPKENRNCKDQQKSSKLVPGNLNERHLSGSLMNATKSSSAKIVPRRIQSNTSNTSKQQNRYEGKEGSPAREVSLRIHSNGHMSKKHDHRKEKETSSDMEIPVMERSGTFLKDEPTFGDKTIDINQ